MDWVASLRALSGRSNLPPLSGLLDPVSTLVEDRLADADLRDSTFDAALLPMSEFFAQLPGEILITLPGPDPHD